MHRREPTPSERLEAMVEGLRERGMTYRDIARESGVSATSIYRFGVGETRQVSHRSFEKIETLFNARMGRMK